MKTQQGFMIVVSVFAGLLSLACNPEEQLEIADLPVDTDSDTVDDDEDTSIILGDTDVDSDTASETEGVPIEVDCNGCIPVGETLENLACAFELCDTDVLRNSVVESPSPLGNACVLEDTYLAVEHYGDTDNDLIPRTGGSYVLLGSGSVNQSDYAHNDYCTDTDVADYIQTDPFKGSDSIFDVVEWQVSLKAPNNAVGFSFEYVFLSAEYDEFISSEFNDKFYAILNAPQTTGGEDRIINYTDCRNPIAYSDFTGESCDTVSGYCCYLAINSAASECCWYPFDSLFAPDFEQPACYGKTIHRTDVSGTGFSCASSVDGEAGNNSDTIVTTGSSTGWLRTTWPIEPGESFTLTFHIHDTADAWVDSMVILDSFHFLKDVASSGTIDLTPDDTDSATD